MAICARFIQQKEHRYINKQRKQNQRFKMISRRLTFSMLWLSGVPAKEAGEQISGGCKQRCTCLQPRGGLCFAVRNAQS
jgi:hypothetical protein